jgi:hypothetical protein
VCLLANGWFCSYLRVNTASYARRQMLDIKCYHYLFMTFLTLSQCLSFIAGFFKAGKSCSICLKPSTLLQVCSRISQFLFCSSQHKQVSLWNSVCTCQISMQRSISYHHFRTSCIYLTSLVTFSYIVAR